MKLVVRIPSNRLTLFPLERLAFIWSDTVFHSIIKSFSASNNDICFALNSFELLYFDSISSYLSSCINHITLTPLNP